MIATAIDGAAIRATSRSLQAPSTVVMIRPHHFAINPQTASDNVFQSEADDRLPTEISAAAYAESTALVDALAAHGVTVHLFEDDATDRPDSVFPNNWFSTHRGGRIVLYPMYTANRRRERRPDVIELLKEQ
ncbi:MAG: amidinotransferase, partial [Phycisphaeraceae bacterium]|nr:amidinotransferase [Phycisphaeraceae bacterium]